MARIRTIKPGFFKHEHLSALDAETQLLAAGLLCYADDEGYFNANPKLIQGEIFPVRELKRKVNDMLTDLEKTGYIRIGKGSDMRTYGHIINFLDHQVVSHSKRSEIKGLQISWNVPVVVQESSIPELNGIEKEQKEKPSAKIAEVDPRHAPVRDFIKQCISHATGLKPAPWSGRDAKALKCQLDANPSWNFETFKRLVQNKFRSDEPRGDPAWKWLPQLSKYADGPLDRFGKVTNGSNQPGRVASLGKQAERNDANKDAILAGIFGGNAGGNATHVGVPSPNNFDTSGNGDVGASSPRLLPRGD